MNTLHIQDKVVTLHNQDALLAIASDKELITLESCRVLMVLFGKLDFENWIAVQQKEIADQVDIQMCHVRSSF